MTQRGNELLWDNGPSFAGGSVTAQELHTAMHGLHAAPWLHYPDISDGDTAPLPPEYCSALLSGYSGLPVDAAGGSTSDGAVVAPPKQPQPSGEGTINFTFFSRPLQRPAPVGVKSTNRLWSTPLFSQQRMAWLQPPPKESRPAAPPDLVRQQEAAAALTQRLQQPEAMAPERPPPSTSLCSDNGDRSQLKRSSPKWLLSQEDEDLDIDDEAGRLRRSAAMSTKRGRIAKRSRDRINEKLRALQQLIPNCNKTDKASMLEEAIEYLKTLQLQVQMMRTMECVLAMKLMQMPPMAHFQHHHLGAMGFDPRLVAQFPYRMIPGMPMFGHGHAMPSLPPFPQPGFVVNNTAPRMPRAQKTPGDHPQVPQAM